MFKSWNKKKKVKTLFKLEFQATQVSIRPRKRKRYFFLFIISDSTETRSYPAFHLHFQVPKLKKSTLTISLVPEDVGKPTVRLQKAAVQDGTCSWENPIYETVKLIREQKTGKLHEKIYHFIVSTVWNGRSSFSAFLLFPIGFS